jgi:hypothetical protein
MSKEAGSSTLSVRLDGDPIFCDLCVCFCVVDIFSLRIAR